MKLLWAVTIGIFLFAAYPAHADSQGRYVYLTSRVVCEVPDADNAAGTETRIVEIEPGQGLRTACPDGSRYIGHYLGGEFVEVLSGIPLPPSSAIWNEPDNGNQ